MAKHKQEAQQGGGLNALSRVSHLKRSAQITKFPAVEQIPPLIHMNDQITYSDNLNILVTAELNEDETQGVFLAEASAMNLHTDNRDGILRIDRGPTFSVVTGQSSYPATMMDSRTKITFRIVSKITDRDDNADDDGPIPFFVG